MERSQAIKNLIALRDRIALRTNVEQYKVLTYETIELIAATQPQNLGELLKVKGIGQKKLGQFGQLILEALGADAGKSGTKAAARPKRNALPQSIRATLFDAVTPSEPDRDVGVAADGSSQIADRGDEPVSVSEYLDEINDALSDGFAERQIAGELSGVSEHPSGIYCTLKDPEDESALACYIPRFLAGRLGHPLQDGMAVVISGTPNIWKPKGRFSLVVSSLTLSGEGALRAAYELLKAKLAAEGIFERKRPLPEFITRIGIITSKRGAVIHDFRTNLARLGLSLLLCDVRVEGASAAGEIEQAIRSFNDRHPDLDLLVVMRGGGSLEDLAAFNHEQVVRALFASRIPTIAAIGHDRDVPLTALAADLAVSTPTAAAVAVNRSWERLANGVPLAAGQLTSFWQERAVSARQRVALGGRSLAFGWERLQRGLDGRLQRFVSQSGVYAGRLRLLQERTAQLQGRLAQAITGSVARFHSRLDNAGRLLKQADPAKVLERGYAVVRGESGKHVRSVENVQEGDSLLVRFSDGEVDTEARRVKSF